MKQQELAPSLDIAAVYRRHVVMVRNRVMRLLGDELAAQEVTQEAFIKYLEHRERRGSEAEVAAFLYRMATNLALNRLRDGLRERELLALRATRAAKGKTVNVHDEILRQVLAQVSYDEAQIGAYYYIDGLEIEEIASLLGAERRTVGLRLTCFQDRARRLGGGFGIEVQHVA